MIPILFNKRGGRTGGAWTPASLLPVAWYTRGGYSAGGTWTDASGNGRDATQGTAGKRPAVDATTYGGAIPACDGVDDEISVPAGVSLPQNDCCIALRFWSDGPRATGQAACLFQHGAVACWMQPDGSIIFQSGFSVSGTPRIRYGDNVVLFRSNGSRVKFTVNGVDYTGSALASATLSGGRLGWFAADALAANHRYADAVYLGADVSDGDAALLATYLTRPVAVAPAAYTDPLVLCYGNSITNGSSSSTAGTAWAGLVDAAITGTVGRFGFPVNTTNNLQDKLPSQIQPLYFAGRAKNVVVIQEIINDLYFGATGAQAYDRIKTLCQTITGYGFEVILLDATPRQDTSTPGDYETQRTSVNGSLAADFPTSTAKTRVFAADTGIAYAKYLVKLSANANFSDPNNATYFNADKVHWTDAGHAQCAGNSSSDVIGALALLGVT
jgi:hypothetical protein